MSLEREDEHMPEDMDMTDFVDDRNKDNNERGVTEMGDDEYNRLIKVINTTSAQARRGKDIQGIPWDGMNTTRENYRITRLEQYKNYEIVPLSGDTADKLRNLVWATSKHDVYLLSNNSVMHWSSLSANLPELLNFFRHVAPYEKHPWCILEGFTKIQISTLAVG